MRQRGDNVIRVDDFNVVRCLNITRSHDAITLFAQAQSHFIAALQLKHHALEVQKNVHHIFLHPIDGRVFMQHASNGHFRCRITHHGRQEHTAQSIAQSVAITTLERLQRDFGTVGSQLLNIDRLGFQQICLHAKLPLNTPGSLHR